VEPEKLVAQRLAVGAETRLSRPPNFVPADNPVPAGGTFLCPNTARSPCVKLPATPAVGWHGSFYVSRKPRPPGGRRDAFIIHSKTEAAMTMEEFELTRAVRAILARHHVDTRKLDVDVFGSSVYIQGELDVADYHPSRHASDRVARELSIKRTLLQIEKEIRRLADVGHLAMQLGNWERVGFNWMSRHAACVAGQFCEAA
jgi:hypothetical protein